MSDLYELFDSYHDAVLFQKLYQQHFEMTQEGRNTARKALVDRGYNLDQLESDYSETIQKLQQNRDKINAYVNCAIEKHIQTRPVKYLLLVEIILFVLDYFNSAFFGIVSPETAHSLFAQASPIIAMLIGLRFSNHPECNRAQSKLALNQKEMEVALAQIKVIKLRLKSGETYEYEYEYGDRDNLDELFVVSSILFKSLLVVADQYRSEQA